VDESGDVVRDVDEDAVLDDAVDDRVVAAADLRVGDGTVGSEIVDDRAGIPRAGISGL
jgi:hypothetical protein